MHSEHSSNEQPEKAQTLEDFLAGINFDGIGVSPLKITPIEEAIERLPQMLDEALRVHTERESILTSKQIARVNTAVYLMMKSNSAKMNPSRIIGMVYFAEGIGLLDKFLTDLGYEYHPEPDDAQEEGDTA